MNKISAAIHKNLETVSTVSEYLDYIKKILDITKNQASISPAFFYRGHAKASYSFAPSAYRKTEKSSNITFRKQEYHLYQELLRRNPRDFSEDKTIFERLVRMQHYGLPTRLLDLTQNPLVALYFACSNEEHDDEDGCVIHLHYPSKKVYYSHAIPDAALAGLEKQLTISNLRNKIINNLVSFFIKLNGLKINTDHQIFDGEVAALFTSLIQLKTQLEQTTDVIQLSGLLSGIEENILPNFFKKWETYFRESYKIQRSDTHEENVLLMNAHIRLLEIRNGFFDHRKWFITDFCDKNGIQYDNQGFQKYHEFLRQFTLFSLVMPPLNNERIKRQQGAFMIFPILKTSHWQPEDFFKIGTILIKSSSKKILREELNLLGVTRSYLFPELPEQAQEIKTLFQPMCEDV